MEYELSKELQELEDQVYYEYTKEQKLRGEVKTSIRVSPPLNEWLQLKRNLKRRIGPNLKVYIDDIRFRHQMHSRDLAFSRKHEWDLVVIVFSLGLMLPIVLPGIIRDLYTYYRSQDYFGITYEIQTRESRVLRDEEKETDEETKELGDLD